jgi:VPDSG-CTERM motif
LTALNQSGPSGLIIGPPNGSGVYATANSSIAGNGPHNPFLNQVATFTLNVPGVNVDSSVNGATFSFGTTAGDNVPGIVGRPPQSIPDGGTTALLLGAALSGLGLIRRKLS